MKNKIVYLALILFVSSTFRAQDKLTDEEVNRSFQESISLYKTIIVNEKTKTQMVTFEIKEGTESFNYQIYSSISKGNLVIELYNSSKERESISSLGNQLENVEETTSTKISGLLDQPEPGTWTIKIMPVNAVAKIEISTETY